MVEKENTQVTAEDKPAAMERTYINRREYDALLDLFGCLSCIIDQEENIKKRAENADHAFDDLMTAKNGLESALAKIARTIPVDKVERLKKEMDTLVVSVEQKGRGFHALPSSKEQYGYFPWKPIVKMVEYLLENECYMCAKTGSEIGQCPYRKAIKDLYPFYVAGNADKGVCVFSGLKALEDLGVEM